MRGFINKLFEDKKVRFLFVGVLNTIFGYAVYALFIYLKMHYFLAQLLSSILAIAHSYLWNKYFTFRSPGRSASEIIRFVSVYAVSYLLNMGILYVSIEFFKWNAYMAGFICLFVTTVISYVGHKNISFRGTTD
jgi:putative flippase GtrA